MAFPQGIYFRATDNQVDPTDHDCIAGGATPAASYPFTTAQGNTVGWESSVAQGRDRTGSGGVVTRGIHAVLTPAVNFRFDLPSTGSYNIRAAFGDATTSQTGGKAQFLDTTTVFATPVAASTSTSAGHFVDASGVDRASQALWASSNVAITNTFSTTIFRTALGGSVSGAAAVATIYIESAGGSPDVTLGITGSAATGSAGTVGISCTVGITGGAATAAAGSVTPGITLGLTGTSATAAVGTISVGGDKTIAITGNGATAAVGSLGIAFSKGITGASATASCGTLALASSLSLTGSNASGAAGAITVSGGDTDQWTPATPDVQSWSAATPDSQVWTPAINDNQNWIEQ